MNNRVAALLVCVGSSLASTGAIAEACHEYSSGPIPDCQPQAQGPVKYSGWDTKGWAYLLYRRSPILLGPC